MSQRNKIIILSVLLAVFAAVLYMYIYPMLRPQSAGVQAPELAESFAPLRVDNPALRLDRLDRIHKMQYNGVHRNIFSATLPPPVPNADEIRRLEAEKNPLPGLPTGPPPLQIDAKFFGYVSDTSGNHRRAFFSSGDEVYICGEGDTLMGRFRVERITTSSTDLEEIASGRRATLGIEQPGPGA